MVVTTSTHKEKIHVVSQNPSLINTIQQAGQSQRPSQQYIPQQYEPRILQTKFSSYGIRDPSTKGNKKY